MSDFIQILKGRRSVRYFSSQPVERETIERMVELATWAPSASNRQEWRFIVIKDQAIKEQIVDLGGSVTIKSAPVVILALYSNQTTNLEYQDHIQSAAAAIQNLLLAAWYLGLGTCWICHLPRKSLLRRLLSVPRSFDPVAAVLLGYPLKPCKKVSRKYNAREIIGFDRFDFPGAQQSSKDSFLPLRRVLLFAYGRLPLFFKRKWVNRFLDKKFVKKFEN